jgi:hypothetical protein
VCHVQPSMKILFNTNLDSFCGDASDGLEHERELDPFPCDPRVVVVDVWTHVVTLACSPDDVYSTFLRSYISYISYIIYYIHNNIQVTYW